VERASRILDALGVLLRSLFEQPVVPGVGGLGKNDGTSRASRESRLV
jgi:hypothetical protein